MSKKAQEANITGSRKLPKYILFDGDGNFHRKPVTTTNKSSHLQFTWEASLVNSPRDIKFEKVNHVGESYLKIEKTGSLPALNFNRKRMFEQEKPNKEPMTEQHVQRYGKYCQRYGEKTDIFCLPIVRRPEQLRPRYEKNSDSYGQFYYEDNKTPQFTGQLELDRQLPSPSKFLSYEVEKPVLKYHSLKSQVFKTSKVTD